MKPILSLTLAGLFCLTAVAQAADDEQVPLPLPVTSEQINDQSIHGKENSLNKIETTPNRTFEEQMHKTINAMHRQAETMTNTGDPDKDFARMLMIQDEATVALAKLYLVHARDEGMRHRAEALIRDRELHLKDVKRFVEPEKK
jgi:hypothetical protein